jgi:hypothetical protein
MIADELNQYLVLYPNYNKYFELSDIVLDLLGAGTLMLAAPHWRLKPSKR